MTYIGSKEDRSKPRIIKARKDLQNKIGTGQISPLLLERMQDYLDDLRIDYRPIADKYISKIHAVTIEFRNAQNPDESYYIFEFVKPVMELKATGGVFNEEVISSISGIVLNLLESSDCRLNQDMMDILDAHNKAINAALALNVRSMKDRKSNDLIIEVRQACMRYQKKSKEAKR